MLSENGIKLVLKSRKILERQALRTPKRSFLQAMSPTERRRNFPE
jgi:hypothetical protein